MPRSNRWSKALTKTILKNGRIICPEENLDIVGDVIIEKDKIAYVGEKQVGNDKTNSIIDCDGLIVMPGAIDMRVQSADPGREHLESLSCLLYTSDAADD